MYSNRGWPEFESLRGGLATERLTALALVLVVDKDDDDDDLDCRFRSRQIA
jgi:hypothetical protein